MTAAVRVPERMIDARARAPKPKRRDAVTLV
jgi:hypothetical protein